MARASSTLWRLVTAPGSETPIAFRKVVIDAKLVHEKRFRSEGVAAADFNGDGKKEIAVGSVWYSPPGGDFTAADWRMHPLRPDPKTYDPRQYSDVFACFAEDLSGDGKPDLIVVDVPGAPTRWYENPGSPTALWKEHLAVSVTNNESPIWADVSGDGRPDLVFGYSPEAKNPDSPLKRLAFASPGKDPRQPWPVRTFSPPDGPGSAKYAHGLGVGDLNGDGRADVIVEQGWYEHPEDPNQPEWPFHPVALGKACAHMLVYDADGDGLNDVLSSSAHGQGIWWYQQVKTGQGVAFQRHDIAPALFSQSHAMVLADINQDGLMDFVVGKRFWAHGPKGDIDPDKPAVLYWFELCRPAKGQAQWTPHQIDDDSGVGTQFEVADVDGDGLLDVITSNKKGVFLFLQARK